ncbi:hypothetical protein [Natrinema pallidum]|uniref:Uncharacterized protein n=1 Tax=Natrinema pallidum DSM 3751 TaxID=1227495 RepID=L9YDC4_9EURY|nr:hypothetical protein [Natrinema pallidum]ELY72074.1 hypothetical protein C487_19713 [Natrinema pallidum DSM 3751]
MTDFDLGEPAPDADEEPDDDASPESEGDQETPTDTDSEHFENVGSDPSEVDMGDSSDESDDEPVDPTETGPAFPYSEVKQSPLYAREDTWTEFEDQLDFVVTPELRRMGIRDDELREIHDVVLEIALDNLEEFDGV